MQCIFDAMRGAAVLALVAVPSACDGSEADSSASGREWCGRARVAQELENNAELKLADIDGGDMIDESRQLHKNGGWDAMADAEEAWYGLTEDAPLPLARHMKVLVEIGSSDDLEDDGEYAEANEAISAYIRINCGFELDAGGEVGGAVIGHYAKQRDGGT